MFRWYIGSQHMRPPLPLSLFSFPEQEVSTGIFASGYNPGMLSNSLKSNPRLWIALRGKVPKRSPQYQKEKEKIEDRE